MIKTAMAAAVAAMLLLPGNASAQTVATDSITEMSSQGVTVRVGPAHTRRASSRRVVRKKVIVRRPAKRCRTVKTTTRVGGRVVTKTVRRCN